MLPSLFGAGPGVEVSIILDTLPADLPVAHECNGDGFLRVAECSVRVGVWCRCIVGFGAATRKAASAATEPGFRETRNSVNHWQLLS